MRAMLQPPSREDKQAVCQSDRLISERLLILKEYQTVMEKVSQSPLAAYGSLVPDSKNSTKSER